MSAPAHVMAYITNDMGDLTADEFRRAAHRRDEANRSAMRRFWRRLGRHA